jgi:Histidine kinase-, DNA gyrase B-, and HSP90-like ATPase
MSSPRTVNRPDLANVVPLRYVARAGLLPELTRQTYDSLYKALREVILNSVDAGATEVVVELSRVESDGILEIADDGEGMTLDELQQSFMSLGGSQKFDAPDKFGRIGVGSLALMHYAQRVEIETKRAGAPSVTKAVIAHPWALDQTQRSQDLGDFRAGDAWEEGARDRKSHFTVIRLLGVDEVLLRECADVRAYYKLVDRLRRILPLSWPGQARLAIELVQAAPDLTHLLRTHAADFCAQVTVRSRWSDEPLTKRMYGDGVAQEERWNGVPRPILKDIVIDEDGCPRTVMVAGYLISQVRPSVEWTGLTARVQNVAVEERTFFDLESDPGFRKYISGEVWLLGDVDRARLVNIDRASFSREAPDYRAIARVMQGEIQRFKVECVQAPQRAKVAIKRRLDQQIALRTAADKLAKAVEISLSVGDAPVSGLPSSSKGSLRRSRERGLIDDLRALGALVAVEREGVRQMNRPYALRVADDGRHILVDVADSLVQPRIRIGRAAYAVRTVEARPVDPPLIVRNRPREIVLNLGHDLFRGQIRQAAVETAMALEFAYLTAGTRSDDDLYDGVLTLLAAG